MLLDSLLDQRKLSTVKVRLARILPTCAAKRRRAMTVDRDHWAWGGAVTLTWTCTSPSKATQSWCDSAGNDLLCDLPQRRTKRGSLHQTSATIPSPTLADGHFEPEHGPPPT